MDVHHVIRDFLGFVDTLLTLLFSTYNGQDELLLSPKRVHVDLGLEVLKRFPFDYFLDQVIAHGLGLKRQAIHVQEMYDTQNPIGRPSNLMTKMDVSADDGAGSAATA